jgi:hypothetical protein
MLIKRHIELTHQGPSNWGLSPPVMRVGSSLKSAGTFTLPSYEDFYALPCC